uniref:Uncharacterized protein n=1 Tax=Anguilla anguilla TaxID=7936 RepID=A0A0E9QZP4_ANGAN
MSFSPLFLFFFLFFF